MSLIDLSIEERGFAPASIALAVRTIGACPAARHRPDARILCGIGVLIVTPDDGGCRFTSDARCLGEGDTPRDLLDWLEPCIASHHAVISWDNFGAVPRRLLALADPVRHPQIITAAADTAGRWRALPLGHTWHLRQARPCRPCFYRTRRPPRSNWSTKRSLAGRHGRGASAISTTPTTPHKPRFGRWTAGAPISPPPADLPPTDMRPRERPPENHHAPRPDLALEER